MDPEYAEQQLDKHLKEFGIGTNDEGIPFNKLTKYFSIKLKYISN